jgi:hypothetical protein
MVYELSDVQAVHQPVVHMYRYWHSASSIRLGDFAEGYPGR